MINEHKMHRSRIKSYDKYSKELTNKKNNWFKNHIFVTHVYI
jgi:hypothetical protein